MDEARLGRILIVGGGTAGWMTAAVLSRFLPPGSVAIELIESDEIGIVGVGEATVPLIQNLNGVLGIDERDFLRRTHGTFKLGIEFRDWGTLGNRHFHGFGDFGEDIEGIAPHHHWLKLRAAGDSAPLGDWSFPTVAAQNDRFGLPPQDFKHAYHFDAGLYARFLRGLAESRGVVRREGQIIDVELRGTDGFIEAVRMQDGTRVAADFFVDCSGFRGLLIEQALHAGYEDWSHWLPCDRAFAVPSENAPGLKPYTISTARAAGWQWCIPLQHRTGNGYVYSSRFASDEEARATLLTNLPGRALAEPRQLKFTTGHRKTFWERNCVAIGLSAGFLEPLESTSILLIQTAIARLTQFFPDRRFDERMRREFNRVSVGEFERVRDFLILHYCLTRRDDAQLWRYCRAMTLPETLRHKIDVWHACGQVPLYSEESFQEPSWVSIFVGQQELPERYDPLIDSIPTDKLRRGLAQRRDAIRRAVASMPTHAEFVGRYCSQNDIREKAS
jgi:tryptophan 7-halogenase